MFSSDSTILIIPFTSSFEMDKMNPFPALTASCPLIFLSNFSNTAEVALVANFGRISLSKGTARSNNAFLPTLLVALTNALRRNPPD